MLERVGLGRAHIFLYAEPRFFLHKVRLGGLPEDERGKNRKHLAALSERPCFGEGGEEKPSGGELEG